MAAAVAVAAPAGRVQLPMPAENDTQQATDAVAGGARVIGRPRPSNRHPRSRCSCTAQASGNRRAGRGGNAAIAADAGWRVAYAPAHAQGGTASARAGRGGGSRGEKARRAPPTGTERPPARHRDDDWGAAHSTLQHAGAERAFQKRRENVGARRWAQPASRLGAGCPGRRGARGRGNMRGRGAQQEARDPGKANFRARPQAELR